LAVGAEIEGAGALVERHAAGLGLRGQVDDDQGGRALLLGADVGDAAVGTDGAVVRLGGGDLADDGVAGGGGDRGLAAAAAGDQHLAAVRRDGQAVGCGADLDAAGHLVGGGVDYADGRGAVAADVDLAAVRRDYQTVRTGRDRNGAEDLIRGGVEYGDGV